MTCVTRSGSSRLQAASRASLNSLSDDGSLWLSIDDTEVHYLKVAMDRIFGREHFVTTVIWQQRTTRENRRVFSNNHEYLLVYAKNFRKFGEARHSLPLTDDVRGRYANPDNDPRGPWQSISANVQAGHAVSSQFYLVKAPNGRQHYPPNGRCWAYNAERMTKEIVAGNVWFGKSGDGVPRLKKFLVSSGKGMTPETLWLAQDVSLSGPLCARHSMTTRSMNATRDKHRYGGQGGAAANSG